MIKSSSQHRKKLKRYNVFDHTCELAFPCYSRRTDFSDQITCTHFLDLIGIAREKNGIELWVYVIMPTHFHLLIWPGEKGYIISEALHSVKVKTARQYRDQKKVSILGYR